jgi:hypothetical protein
MKKLSPSAVIYAIKLLLAKYRIKHIGGIGLQILTGAAAWS